MLENVQINGWVLKSWSWHFERNTIPYYHSLWRRANTRSVSFETLYGGQFTLSTQLIIPNYLEIWRLLLCETKHQGSKEVLTKKKQTNRHRTEILIHLRASIAFRSKSFYFFNIFSRNQDHQSKSAKMEKCCRRKTHSINPLTPKISLVILLTVFHTLIVRLVWRI